MRRTVEEDKSDRLNKEWSRKEANVAKVTTFTSTQSLSLYTANSF